MVFSVTPERFELSTNGLRVHCSAVELRSHAGINCLRVISPTDCVKDDRLAGYYFWGDRQSLVQALLVAINNRINLADISRWSQVSGNLSGFEVFHEKYANQRRSRGQRTSHRAIERVKH